MLLLHMPGPDMREMKMLQREARPAKPAPKPLVFVLDDDISIRESLELLLRAAGRAPGDLRIPRGVPRRATPRRAELPHPRHVAARTEWTPSARAHRRRAYGYANHL